MPSARETRVLGFRGGLATDLPTQTRTLDYWLKMENVIFEVSGAVRKLGGSSKVNATAMSGGPDVLGAFDFWRGGGSAAFTQKFVVVTGDSKVYKEDMDGTFDDITGAASITAGALPIFSQARDLLTIWTSSNDTPLKWNQSGNVASLGGTPPVGRGMVFHANRGWSWGENANASRLSYSSSTDIEDWSGADTGSIDIDPEDGDRIVGVASYKQVLLVFKGPNKGSIHQISGTAPTGADAFTRKVLVRGIPLQAHNSIVPVGDDILFMSDRGVHSMAAVQAFGNFAEADITRFLKKFFRESVNRAQLHKVWGVNYADKSCAVWCMPMAGATENDITFGLSYIRLEEEGWKPFTWTRGGLSATTRINPATNLRDLAFGTTDGFVTLQDTSSRSINGTTAYNMRILSPDMLLGNNDAGGVPRGDLGVTLSSLWLRSVASGNYDITMDIHKNGVQSEQTYSFNQGSPGFTLDTSQLDVDVLGGSTTQIIYANPNVVGSARSVQFEIQQGGLNEDANMLEFGLDITPDSTSHIGT